MVLIKKTFLFVAFILGSCDLPYSSSSSVKLNSDVLTHRPCGFSILQDVSIKCYLAKPSGVNELESPVVVLSSSARNPQEGDALFVIPGGPGQGGLTGEDWVGIWADWIKSNDISLDVVLYEPRGTWGSNSFWRCEEFENKALMFVGQDLDIEEEAVLLSPINEKCISEYDSYLKSTMKMLNGVAEFNTKKNADDLNVLIHALNYSHVHLLGTSYGSRVALLAASLDAVGTVILDSPYPFHRGQLSDWPELIGNAIKTHEKLFKEAMSSPLSYHELFAQARLYLDKFPQRYMLERWDGESTIEFVLNGDRLLSVQFDVLYNAEMLPLFYQGLMAIKSKPEELKWVLENFVTNTFDAEFSTMVFYATECNDNGLSSEQSFLASVAQYESYGIDWKVIYQTDVCHHPLFQNFKDDNVVELKNKKYVSKPTLVFSGQLDPVTPRNWAVELVDKHPQAKLIAVSGVGHGVLSSDVCRWNEIKHFWQFQDYDITMMCHQLPSD